MKPLPSTSVLKIPPRDPGSDPSHPRSRSTSITHTNPKQRGLATTTSLPSEASDEDADEDAEEEEFDSLSDMEAGFSDVEEEDERALKAAKKEDLFEAMMEKELKRQKERKKREAAAAAARGRPSAA